MATDTTRRAQILRAEIDALFAQPSKRTLRHAEAINVLAKLDGRKNDNVVGRAKDEGATTQPDDAEAIRNLPTAFRLSSLTQAKAADEDGKALIPPSWGFVGTPEQVRQAEVAADAAVMNAVHGFAAAMLQDPRLDKLETYQSFEAALCDTLKTGIMGFCHGCERQPAIMAGNMLAAYVLHTHGADALDEATEIDDPTPPTATNAASPEQTTAEAAALLPFTVNVRAVVTTGNGDGQVAEDWPWDVYDHDRNVVRCDTPVKVMATDARAAIEQAKANAPPLDGIGYSIEDVELWVDEGIDVTAGH